MMTILRFFLLLFLFFLNMLGNNNSSCFEIIVAIWTQIGISKVVSMTVRTIWHLSILLRHCIYSDCELFHVSRKRNQGKACHHIQILLSTAHLWNHAYRNEHSRSSPLQSDGAWKHLCFATLLSCLCFLIRSYIYFVIDCVYRYNFINWVIKVHHLVLPYIFAPCSLQSLAGGISMRKLYNGMA